MFIHNQIIDAVQGAKKQFVNTVVTDAKFKEELNKLIDAQAAATKTSVEASLAIASAFTKQATDAFKTLVPATSK
jgi:hypothetical protein